MQRPNALALALLLAAPLAACSHPPSEIVVHAGANDKETALTATGSATLDVAPDCADLTMTVSSDAAQPGPAVADVEKRQAALIAALEKRGVAEKDLKLSQLGVGEVTHWDGTRTIHDGFSAAITITATTRAFDQIGPLMQVAADAGVVDMSSRFRRSDLDAIRKQVREQALQAAQAKAKDTAATLGLHLGRITAVSDASQSALYTSEYFTSTGNGGGVGGENEPLTIDVTLTYEI